MKGEVQDPSHEAPHRTGQGRLGTGRLPCGRPRLHRPASWTDEYRRILKLIDNNVGPNRMMNAEPMSEKASGKRVAGL
ncbi:MAG TPA: hypothetical protein VKP65_10645 [Rhodothermales bacterium]|nr:hypothetical protein [Rhodothermales bacterium]